MSKWLRKTSGTSEQAALILIGFTAAAAQIVLLRELMAAFGGSEMSIGLMLAAWLLWTAAGSAAAGRWAPRVREPRRIMAVLQLLVAAALPATILGVLAVRSILQTAPGESLGPIAALLVSFAALSLFCGLSGALFAAGSWLVGGGAAKATGATYLLEALGSASGGLTAGLALTPHLGALAVACVLGLLNLASASALILRSLPARLAAGVAAAVLAVPALAPWGAAKVEFAALQRLWPGFRLAAVSNSRYGSLAVVEAVGVRSLYEDGLLLFHTPDPEGAEEAVHYALLEHPAPRSLLLIGGGLNGAIAQALQHPSIESIDYVELDPAILAMARGYFPREWAAVASDRRVHIHVADGRRFVRTTESRFDVVIVNLPEPQTALLNRFFTLEFFREAAAKMTPGGVLSLQLAASENYISPGLAAFLRSISKTLRMAFPDVMVIPGESAHFVAARRAGVLTRDPDELLARQRARRLRTEYVREYYLPFRMARVRMSALESRIRPLPATPVNRDFTPVAYYFDAALWSSRFQRGSAGFFGALAGVGFGRLVAGACLAAAAFFGLYLVSGASRGRVAVASCAAGMGFTLIGLEVLLLLAFQAIHGYVYHQLAILIAGFMAGMALGAALSIRGSRGAGALAACQAAAVAAPLAVCAIIPLVPPSLFFVLALLCGMLGGYQFPVASRVYFSSGRGGWGAVYALDLAGSCIGAALFSVYLIPVFGFYKTALAAGVLNLAPLAAAMLAMRAVNHR